MTSILKVDTLQTAAGGVPTAGDLGIGVATADMPAGSIIATHTLASPANSQVGLASDAFSTVDTFTITTRANSKLAVWMDVPQFTKTTANTNLYFRLLVDGTSQGDHGYGSPNNSSWQHSWYGENSSRQVLYNHMVTNALTAGSHTINVQAARYSSGTIQLRYQGAVMRYHIQEIAG